MIIWLFGSGSLLPSSWAVRSAWAARLGVKSGTTVLSTSTRNFPQRVGDDTSVYLGSAELAAITAKFGRLPTVVEYRGEMAKVAAASGEVYRDLNFDQLSEYSKWVVR